MCIYNIYIYIYYIDNKYTRIYIVYCNVLYTDTYKVQKVYLIRFQKSATGGRDIFTWHDPKSGDFPNQNHTWLGNLHGLAMEDLAKISWLRNTPVQVTRYIFSFLPMTSVRV